MKCIKYDVISLPHLCSLSFSLCSSNLCLPTFVEIGLILLLSSNFICIFFVIQLCPSSFVYLFHLCLCFLVLIRLFYLSPKHKSTFIQLLWSFRTKMHSNAKRTTILGRINNILFIKLLKDSAALEYIFITGNGPALDVAVCPGGASSTKLFLVKL